METLTTSEQSKTSTVLTIAKNKQQPFFSFKKVQPKLTISQADDPNEREADLVADKVGRMPNKPDSFFRPSARQFSYYPHKDNIDEVPFQLPPSSTKGDEDLHIKRDGISNGGIEAPSIINDVILTGGQPLPSHTRNFFEPRFGHDFSSVRIHTDNKAAESAKSINAYAYTFGNNIVFGDNQYVPETETGKKLLAHELTHVVQQNHLNNQIQRDEKEEEEEIILKEDENFRWEGDQFKPSLRVRTSWLISLGIASGTEIIKEDGYYKSIFYPVFSQLVKLYPWFEGVEEYLKPGKGDEGFFMEPGIDSWKKKEMVIPFVNDAILLFGLPPALDIFVAKIQDGGIAIYVRKKEDVLDTYIITEKIIPVVERQLGGKIVSEKERSAFASEINKVVFQIDEKSSVAKIEVPPDKLEKLFGAKILERFEEKAADLNGMITLYDELGIQFPSFLIPEDRKIVENLIQEIFGKGKQEKLKDSSIRTKELTYDEIMALINLDKDPDKDKIISTLTDNNNRLASKERTLTAIIHFARLKIKMQFYNEPTEFEKQLLAIGIDLEQFVERYDGEPIYDEPVEGAIHMPDLIIPGKEVGFTFEVKELHDPFWPPIININWQATRMKSNDLERDIVIATGGNKYNAYKDPETMAVTFDKTGLYSFEAYVNHEYYLPNFFRIEVLVKTAQEIIKENMQSGESRVEFGELGFGESERILNLGYKLDIIGTVPFGLESKSQKIRIYGGFLSEEALKRNQLTESQEDLDKLVKQLDASISEYRSGNDYHKDDMIEYLQDRKDYLIKQKTALQKDAENQQNKQILTQAFYVSGRGGIQSGKLKLVTNFQVTEEGDQTKFSGIIRDMSSILDSKFRLYKETNAVSFDELMFMLFRHMLQVYPIGTLSFSYQERDATLTPLNSFKSLEGKSINDPDEFSEKEQMGINFIGVFLSVFNPILGAMFLLAYNAAALQHRIEQEELIGESKSHKLDIAQLLLDVVPALGLASKSLRLGGKMRYLFTATELGVNFYLLTNDTLDAIRELRGARVDELVAVQKEIQEITEIRKNMSDPRLDELRLRETKLILEIRNSAKDVLTDSALSLGITVIGSHGAAKFGQKVNEHIQGANPDMDFDSAQDNTPPQAGESQSVNDKPEVPETEPTMRHDETERHDQVPDQPVPVIEPESRKSPAKQEPDGGGESGGGRKPSLKPDEKIAGAGPDSTGHEPAKAQENPRVVAIVKQRKKQLLKNRPTAFKALLEAGESWDDTIETLLAMNDPAGKLIAQKLNRYRKKIKEKVATKFDATLIAGSGDELLSDLDYQFHGQNAGASVLEAEAKMAAAFGKDWKSKTKMNFYTEAGRMLLPEEIPTLNNPAKLAEWKIANPELAAKLESDISGAKEIELTEQFTFAQRLMHAGENTEAKRIVLSSIEQAGADYALIEKLAGIPPAERSALRKKLLLDIDDLIIRYGSSTSESVKIELAFEIRQKQMEANFFSDEAYIGPGAMKQTTRGETVKGLDAYTSVLSDLALLDGIIYGDYKGDLFAAFAGYKPSKYIYRISKAIGAEQVDFFFDYLHRIAYKDRKSPFDPNEILGANMLFDDFKRFVSDKLPGLKGELPAETHILPNADIETPAGSKEISDRQLEFTFQSKDISSKQHAPKAPELNLGPTKKDIKEPDAPQLKTALKGGILTPEQATGEGFLTPGEVAELQSIADRFRTRLFVVGSRAKGQGRNIFKIELPTELPSGEKGLRSDIDVRIDGQVDIDSNWALSNEVHNVGNGAGKTLVLIGVDASPPAIVFDPE